MRVKQSPPVVVLLTRKEHALSQVLGRRVLDLEVVISTTGECATFSMSLRSVGDNAFVGKGKSKLRTKIAVNRKENMSTDGVFFKQKGGKECL